MEVPCSCVAGEMDRFWLESGLRWNWLSAGAVSYAVVIYHSIRFQARGAYCRLLLDMMFSIRFVALSTRI